jgi:sodium-dependent dicarboxylate transporter 2/3/5
MDESNRNSAEDTEEIKETISPAEERFEKIRKTIGLFLGPAAFLILFFVPIPSLSYHAHTLTAIIGWIVIWWITEPIPIPVSAVFGAVLCVITGVGDVRQVFAPFADPIIFLFLGSFILAKAMSVHSLDRRFAYGIMSIGWVGNSTGRILFVFGAISAFISMWVSNTATTAMMLPIGIGIVYAMSEMISEKTGKKVNPMQLRFGTGMMLMAAYASSAGGIGTPVGTPPNIIGIAMIEKFAGVKIPFFQWMLFAVPLLVIMYILLFVLMYFMHKPELSNVMGSREFVSKEKSKLGKWTRGQKNSLIAFLVTVVLWITPGFIALFYGTSSQIYRSYNNAIPEGASAMVCAVLLFVLPLNWKERKFTVTWKQAIGIDWGTLLLFGGGLTLGNLMFETKLAEAVGKGLMDFSGAESLWGVTLAAIFISIIVSEATSNTASANMVVPVIISLCIAAGINPVPPAIGATLGASWGFMLPVSTPPNAIVYGSGMVPITRMIRAGIVFDLLGGLIIWLGLRLLLPLVGLG